MIRIMFPLETFGLVPSDSHHPLVSNIVSNVLMVRMNVGLHKAQWLYKGRQAQDP